MSGTNVRFGIKAHDSTGAAFAKARQNLKGLRREQAAMGTSVLRNRRVIQQAGMQMSDFAVQVAGGQSAILAFTQNVPQFVQGFGAIGGVLAALITIAGTLTLVAVRTGASLDSLTPITGILSEQFRSIALAMSMAKEFAIDMANVLVNNLDRVLIYASTFAGLMAGKWVISFIAARGAVGLLVGSLVLLRGALIRTGIGALIVAAGELVYQFMRLVKAVGGVGEAFKLVWQAASEAFQNIDITAQALWDAMRGVAWSIVAVFIKGFKKIADGWHSVVQGMSKPFNKLMQGMGLDDFMIDASTGAAASITLAKDLATAQQIAGDAFAASASGFNRAIPTLERMRQLLKKLDDTGSDIDIREWFKGGDGEDDGAGGSVKNIIDDTTKSMQSLADTMKSSFSEGFMSIVKGTQSVGDAFRSMASRVIEKLFDILVVQRMVGSFNATTGKGTGLVGMLMGAFKLPFFDSGGFLGAGQSGIVGERGPEIVTGTSRGAVITGRVDTSRALSQQRGGDVININQTFHLSTGVTETVRQEVEDAAPTIIEAAKSAVLEARLRGGSYAQAWG